MLVTSLERQHESNSMQIIHLIMVIIHLFHILPKAVSRRGVSRDAPLRAWLHLLCLIARSERSKHQCRKHNQNTFFLSLQGRIVPCSPFIDSVSTASCSSFVPILTPLYRSTYIKNMWEFSFLHWPFVAGPLEALASHPSGCVKQGTVTKDAES